MQRWKACGSTCGQMRGGETVATVPERQNHTELSEQIWGGMDK